MRTLGAAFQTDRRLFVAVFGRPEKNALQYFILDVMKTCTRVSASDFDQLGRIRAMLQKRKKIVCVIYSMFGSNVREGTLLSGFQLHGSEKLCCHQG